MYYNNSNINDINICNNNSDRNIDIITNIHSNNKYNSSCHVHRIVHPSQRRSPEYQLEIRQNGAKLKGKRSQSVFEADVTANSGLGRRR
jgi:hypothetical protein